MIFSASAQMRSAGSQKHARIVTFLTPEERAAVKAGELVVFDSGRMSGGNHGTTLRMVIYTAGRYYARVPQIQRIVTDQKRSWRWQDAYVIATYRPHVTRDGRTVWESVSRSGRYSRPQLGDRWNRIAHGSLHHRPIVKEG